MKTISYVRVSTNKEDVNNQKVELYEYARKKELTIDDIIETQIPFQKDLL